jgi:hypothetical protein
MNLVFNCLLRLDHRNISVSVAGVVRMAGVFGGIPDIMKSHGGILDISKDMGGISDICRQIKHLCNYLRLPTAQTYSSPISDCRVN